MTAPHDLAERALRFAAGGGERLVIAEHTASAFARWADGALTANGITTAMRVTVVAAGPSGAGTGVGVVAATGAVDDASLRDLMAAAEHAARGPAADGAEPFVAGEVAGDWDEAPAAVDPAAIGRVAEQVAESADAMRAAEVAVSGYAEQRVCSSYLASSTGLRLRHEQPAAVVDLAAVAAGGAATAWSGGGGRSVADIDIASRHAAMAERLRWSDRRVAVPPGAYEVLLPPSCVADLMVPLYRAAGADDALEGRGPFARPYGSRLGERIAGIPLTLRSDPDESGLECAPFTLATGSDERTSVFDNGMPLRPTEWLADGVLAALVHTRATARRSGARPTGAIDNLVLEAREPAATPAEMVAGTRRGLLLTSLWYLRTVDPATLQLTGLTRDGVFLVEDGEVVGAAADFRFNESPVAVLGRATEAGPVEPTIPREWGDYFTRVAMPTLRVDGFTMAGPA